MLFGEESFNTLFEGISITIQEHTLGVTKVFRVTFADKRTPLMITRISTSTGKTWVSIPQVRQKEAEQIGAQIIEHFSKK